MKTIDKERYTLFIEAFAELYEVDAIMSKYNLIHDATDLGEQYSLCCPFHDDILPSFRIDKEKGIWHCFGCNTGGHLFKLLYMLSGSGLPMTMYAESFLKKDEQLQKALGFDSLFKQDSILQPDRKFEREIFKLDKTFDIPISILAKTLKSRDNSYRTLSMSLELLQEGVNAKQILDTMGKVQYNLTHNTIELSDLILDEEEESMQ